jgi:diaminohydroxyphosphoribosylaminopyrimidine deaminase/5-amino-6-(5-phosphoribosylamino)uracil reductase
MKIETPEQNQPVLSYMQRAIQLAQRGIGFVNPNPLVGCVIVKNGQVIGEGYHAKYGDLHAERMALRNCTTSPEGADLYVTLEPCCHTGKQPPCTEAILEAGIRRVFVGSADPNPLVAGKGIQQLRDAGVTVVTDVMRQECDACNPFFLHYMKTGLPYVIGKYAMSADGKIACCTGHSQWITDATARAHVQQTRKRVAAILIGIRTLLADDPSLLCHLEEAPSHPVRVICDSHLRIPEDCQVLRSIGQAPVWVMTCSADTAKIQRLTARGAKVFSVPQDDQGHTDLRAVLEILGKQQIDSVLLEGGAQMHTAAITEGLLQELQVYIGAVLIGGDGISPIRSLQVEKMQQAVALHAPVVTALGSSVLLRYLF